METVNKPKFLADEMLGRLAKWLRLLGYDTKYSRRIPDSEIIDIAESEGRIILTRDTRLVLRKRCRDYIFIREDRWRAQLRQVYLEAGLNRDAALTICAVCNEPLRPIPKGSLEARVPAYVYETQEEFAECAVCSRVFWEATHTRKIIDELARLIEER